MTVAEKNPPPRAYEREREPEPEPELLFRALRRSYRVFARSPGLCK